MLNRIFGNLKIEIVLCQRVKLRIKIPDSLMISDYKVPQGLSDNIR